MGDIVNLRNTPFDLNTDLGHAFVVDATRAAEGLITDKELSEKYELSPADWRAIRKDKSIGVAVRTERERRVRSGQAVKEAAARHLIKGVGIVDQIMSSDDSHPKHKLEAFKELRQTAAVGADAEGRSGDRFVITIIMNSDEPGGNVVEHYDKSIAVDPNDIDPNNVKINLDESHGER
jgi:hydroxypyruvate isomerase